MMRYDDDKFSWLNLHSIIKYIWVKETFLIYLLIIILILNTVSLYWGYIIIYRACYNLIISVINVFYP